MSTPRNISGKRGLNSSLKGLEMTVETKINLALGHVHNVVHKAKKNISDTKLGRQDSEPIVPTDLARQNKYFGRSFIKKSRASILYQTYCGERINRCALRFENPEIEQDFQICEQGQNSEDFKWMLKCLFVMYIFVWGYAAITYMAKGLHTQLASSENAKPLIIAILSGVIMCLMILQLRYFYNFAERTWIYVAPFLLIIAGCFQVVMADTNGFGGLLFVDWVSVVALRGRFYATGIVLLSLFAIFNCYQIANMSFLKVEYQDLAGMDILVMLVSTLVASKNHNYQMCMREKFLLQKQSQHNQERIESVLNHIFPEHINAQMKTRKSEILADGIENLTIIFCDVTQFKDMLNTLQQTDVVSILDALWTLFDCVCEKYSVHKMETVGKTFMACAGIPGSNPEHAAACVAMGLELVHYAKECDIKIRAGVHSGTAIAGVVGCIRPQYSLFGDTVNTTARVQAHGKEMCVNVSDQTLAMLDESQIHGEKIQISAKGKGLLNITIISSPPKTPLLELESHEETVDDGAAHYHVGLEAKPRKLRNGPRLDDPVLHAQYIAERRDHGRFRGFIWPAIVTISFLICQSFLTDTITTYIAFGLCCLFGIVLLLIGYFAECVSSSVVYALQIGWLVGVLGTVITLSFVEETTGWGTKWLFVTLVYSLSINILISFAFKFSHVVMMTVTSFFAWIGVMAIAVLVSKYFELLEGVYLTVLFCLCTMLGLLDSYIQDFYLRNSFKLTKQVNNERVLAEKILYQMIPTTEADLLRTGMKTAAQVYEKVTILYSDIVQFTAYSASSTPTNVVKLLSNLFSIWDLLTEKHEVYKVQTIGDAYVVVSGFPFVSKGSPAEFAYRCIQFAVDMIRAVNAIHTEEGFKKQLRVGIHTGSCIAGVIGVEKLRYDIWGEDCLFANQLESNSPVGCVLISADTYDLLADANNKGYQKTLDALKPHGSYKYANKGEMATYCSSLPVEEDCDQAYSVETVYAKFGIKPPGIETKKVTDLKTVLPTRVVFAGPNQQYNNSKKCTENVVTNTKFTLLSFLPVFLYSQFKRATNKYFLFIACLQLEPTITPVRPESTWLPLCLIFAFSGVKEALDDYGRYKADKLVNKNSIKISKNVNGDRKVVVSESQEIKVGDIVYLTEGDDVPSDLVLLKSSYPDGHCFIQTTNLDGESNLKNRQAPASTQALSDDQILTFDGCVECSIPTPDLYEFDSRIWIECDDHIGLDKPPQSSPISLEGFHLLQQGTRLKNTEWVYGLAVYCGNQTKFGQNKQDPKVKWTKSDNLMDTVAIVIFLVQIFLVFLLGIAGNLLNGISLDFIDSSELGLDHWYIHNQSPSLFVIPARYLLLTSTFVPISLKVCLDVCKMAYAHFIKRDIEMYDSKAESGVVVNNSNIAEDLGEVEYVLSDKTGTLTQNNMFFECCSIEGKVYKNENDALATAVKEGKCAETDFLRNLALNSSVMPTKNEEVTENGLEYTYRGSSPDEIALVEAAAKNGVILVFRDITEVHITVNGTIEKYEKLQELEFNSERKRMSVVFRNMETGKLEVLVKGADEVLTDKLVEGTEGNLKVTLDDIKLFAHQGLRTLFFAYRCLDTEMFAKWQADFHEANTSLVDRAEKVSDIFAQLECELLPQGASAIEDLLQEGVGDTIKALSDAGIKLWMLTGDKNATAMQIALTCNLRSKATPEKPVMVCELEGISHEGIMHNIRVHIRQLEHEISVHPNLEVTVLVPGPVLSVILPNEDTKESFLELCLAAHLVIGCRVTPQQKGDLVKMVKDLNKITLAVGDGGNDVCMIQEANIGVGIRGKEGLQAARASDYAVPNFRCLQQLILVHGHYSTFRSSTVIQYSFYKSFFFCWIQIVYARWTNYSGTPLFNSLCITAYNMVLFLPTLTFVFDQDVPKAGLLQFPAIYKSGKEFFTYRTISVWMIRGLLQAWLLTLTVVEVGWYYTAPSGKDINAEAETLGLGAFYSYLWVQTITVSFTLKNLTKTGVAVIWGAHVAFYVVAILFSIANKDFITVFNGYWTSIVALDDPCIWLQKAFCLVACVFPFLTVQFWWENYLPTLTNRVAFFMRYSTHHVMPFMNDDGMLSSSAELNKSKREHRAQDKMLALEEFETQSVIPTGSFSKNKS